MKILINIVSLMHKGWQGSALPGCFFAPPTELARLARAIGYEGAMLVPIRGMDGSEEGTYYEGPWDWMPDSGLLPYLWQRRELRACVIQWLVSPGRTACQRVMSGWESRNMLMVTHEVDHDPSHIVEIHRGLGSYGKHLDHDQPLCFDSGHWAEWGLGTEDITTELAERVALVHLNPGNTHEYLKQRDKRKAHLSMVERVFELKGGQTDLVIEYNPGLECIARPNHSRAMAEEMLCSASYLR